MNLQACLAFIHYTTFSILLSALLIEWVLLAPTIPASHALKIKRADLVYGISAGIMLVSGIGRVFYEKGTEYYFHNHLFWSKIAIFFVIATLSIVPTIRYLRWKPGTEGDFVIEAREYSTIRRLIRWQLLLLPLIPLCAVFMARGIGQ